MGELDHVGSFKELTVYRKTRLVAARIFRLTTAFPRDERYSLTDQIRRSSRSVGAQIAEAWGKRRYEKHFASKLSDADSENYETQHWLDIALECGYVTAAETKEVNGYLLEVGRMLNSMIQKAHLFCSPGADLVREDAAEYIVCGEEDD